MIVFTRKTCKQFNTSGDFCAWKVLTVQANETSVVLLKSRGDNSLTLPFAVGVWLFELICDGEECINFDIVCEK